MYGLIREIERLIDCGVALAFEQVVAPSALCSAYLACDVGSKELEFVDGRASPLYLEGTCILSPHPQNARQSQGEAHATAKGLLHINSISCRSHNGPSKSTD